MLIQRNPVDGSYAFLHRTLSKLTLNYFSDPKYIYKNLNYKLPSQLIDGNINIKANTEDNQELYLINDELKILNKNIKNLWSNLKKVYINNLNKIVNYHINNLNNNLDEFKILNISKFKTELIELKIYLDDNIEHLNYCLIFFHK